MPIVLTRKHANLIVYAAPRATFPRIQLVRDTFVPHQGPPRLSESRQALMMLSHEKERAQCSGTIALARYRERLCRLARMVFAAYH